MTKLELLNKLSKVNETNKHMYATPALLKHMRKAVIWSGLDEKEIKPLRTALNRIVKKIEKNGLIIN